MAYSQGPLDAAIPSLFFQMFHLTRGVLCK